MDIKREIEIKNKPFEIIEVDSDEEEVLRESKCFPNIDIKNEIRIKDESLDIKEESAENCQFHEEFSGLDGNQESKSFPIIYIKEKTGIEDQSLDVKEESSENWQCYDKFSGLDGNQWHSDPEEDVLSFRDAKEIKQRSQQEQEFFQKLIDSKYPLVVFKRLSKSIVEFCSGGAPAILLRKDFNLPRNRYYLPKRPVSNQQKLCSRLVFSSAELESNQHKLERLSKNSSSIIDIKNEPLSDTKESIENCQLYNKICGIEGNQSYSDSEEQVWSHIGKKEKEFEQRSQPYSDSEEKVLSGRCIKEEEF